MTPRSVAVLVALRGIPRTSRALAGALGEPAGTRAVSSLLSEMQGQGLIELERGYARSHERWVLAPAGLAWLESQGLGRLQP